MHSITGNKKPSFKGVGIQRSVFVGQEVGEGKWIENASLKDACSQHEKEGDIPIKELVMGNHGGVLPLIAWTRRVMALGTKLMRFILSVLRNTDRPIPVYVWHAWLIDGVPSIVVAAIVVAALFGTNHSAETPPLLHYMTTSMVFWEVMVKAPWTETLIMWPILFLLRLILGNTIWVPVASGLIWGNLHAFGGLQSGVSQIWGFFVLSVCFLEWEKKSKGLAILVTGLVHMCSNVVAFLLFLLLRTFFH